LIKAVREVVSMELLIEKSRQIVSAADVIRSGDVYAYRSIRIQRPRVWIVAAAA
jgi:hypothetical protein